MRRRLGLTYWSLSAWAKLKVKNAVNFIGRFEEFLIAEARRAEADGVICGHIHHAASRMVGDMHYLNTGDWVESCTAVVEHYDGTMEVIRFAEWKRANAETAQPLTSRSPPAAPAAPVEELAPAARTPLPPSASTRAVA